MVAGKEIYRDGHAIGINEDDLRKRLETASRKLESTQLS